MTTATAELPQCRVAIRDRLDVHDVQAKARAVGQALGFAPQRIAEAQVVVTELATNILRHSAEGFIDVAGDRAESTLALTAEDVGPAIANFAQALRDGSGPDGPILPATTDSPFGSATGLGAVSRLSDALEHATTAAGGNRITARLRRRDRI